MTEPPLAEPATVSIAQAADILGISYSSITRAIDRGDIPAIKFGHRRQIPRHVIDRLLAEGNTQPADPIAS